VRPRGSRDRGDPGPQAVARSIDAPGFAISAARPARPRGPERFRGRL